MIRVDSGREIITVLPIGQRRPNTNSDEDGGFTMGNIVTTGDVDQEEIESVNLEESRHKEDIKLLAMDYMESFFWDKTLADGTEIPRQVLYTEENVSLVINSRMARGISMFYRVFNEEFESHSSQDSHLPADVAFLMFVHRECAHRGIPKQYASGISILYLRLCAKIPRKMRKSA